MSEYTKIRKSDALKRYNNGKVVRIMASKMNPDSFWGEPIPINNQSGRTFEQVCNEFAYYNCSKETGLRLCYYVKESD